MKNAGGELRALLYARVSKSDGDQDPVVQLRTLQEWAASRGWRVVAEEADKVTGDPARRHGEPPGLRRALQALADRRADVLVVFAADRLERSTVGLLQLVARVQSVGAHVASYQDGGDLDTTTDTGEFLTFMRGWFARMELKLIRRRTIAGLNDARARGIKLGRPLGPSAPDPEMVRDMRKRGCSWGQIARKLGCSKGSAERAFQRAAKGLPENVGAIAPRAPVEEASTE